MGEDKKFDYCYRYLYYHSTFNTLLGLPFFVNRDFFPSTRLSIGLSYFYQYMSEIWMILGLISGAIAIAIVWTDVNILFGCISSTSHMTQIVSKILLFKWKKKEFLKQLSRLNAICERNELLRIDGDVVSFERFSYVRFRHIKILEWVMMIVMFVWTSIYFLPFMYNSIIHSDSLENVTSPIIAYFPFEYGVTPVYQLVVIYQAILFFFYNLKTVAIDYFVLGFIVLHIMQFKYLDMTLQRVTLILTEEKPEQGSPLDFRTTSFLHTWIKQHQDIMKAAGTSVELLSVFFLIEFGYIIVHTCVPAFVITSTLSWTLSQKIALIFMCTGSIINLYLLSLSGDVFSESNEEFGVTFYGPHLFQKKKLYQIIHKMLLLKGRNKSKVFGYSNVFPLCSVTFGTILRMVMSCYLALNQIKGLKNKE